MSVNKQHVVRDSPHISDPYTQIVVITNVMFMRRLAFHIQMFVLALLIERKLKARHIDHHNCVIIAGKIETGLRYF
jgi:hypothetical protein